ncbi:hypothetical protein BGZ83_006462 [Gryganskiella cystojenkinii]|nr:hypothetical protein BGZ83_006462 [Gryganskiella cystojenkinii]
MSAKMGSTAPSPSIANLASKVINRLANNSNINNVSMHPGNNNNNNNININNNNNNNDSTLEDDEDGDGDGDDDESADNDEDDEDAGIIRCICNYIDDDGFTIQCERCLVWQHAVCVGIVQSNVPDKYLCELCSPRPVDRKRANDIQRRRIGNLDRRRERSPSRRKPSVGRPRKPFGGSASEQGLASPPSSSTTPSSTTSGSNTLLKHLPKDQGVGASSISGANTGNGQARGSSSLVDSLHRKGKTGSNKSSATAPGANSSSSAPASSLKPRPAINNRTASAAVEDEDLDMESDSQDDVLDAYQFEFSSVEANIVTSKTVQDLFCQVIAQFRQAQSRKRSLSLTSGVKLQELVGSSANSLSKANDSANSSLGINNNYHNGHLAASAALSTATSSSSVEAAAFDSPEASSTGNGATNSSIIGSMDASNVVSMERESLARPLMRTTVKHILSSSKLHPSPAPQYGLFADSNISAGRFMLEFKGEVLLKSTYKSDPINQYSILATPKPFVLFHPQLNLAVDARRSGNDARFVRRSCSPNTEVKSIVVPGMQDQTVHLGLFAKVPIGKGQEITLDWDWNRDHPALQSLRSSKDGIGRKSSKEIRKAKHLVASTLFAQTDCACEVLETCVLHRMWKDGTSEPSSRESDSTSKGGRQKKVPLESMRQRYKTHQGTSGFESHEGKRSTGQDSSEDELSPAAETSPRKKALKDEIKLEGSSKKARRDLHSHHRGSRREENQDSDSNSDDNRRRKLSGYLDQQGSSSRRVSNAGQEMSAREMKHALQQIKKMEDKDSGKRAQRDALSQSSATSDSDRAETASGRNRSSTSIVKKQPYATSARGRRMADHASGLSDSKDRTTFRQIAIARDPQGRPGSSSVETSFVSVVGNTSDEEEETSKKADRRHQRENDLPKATLPVPSPKPSAMPCKKLWKMIYMKQRAVAEEEAREKAEEMRRKAEEVFDLKMEEDETVDIIDHSPVLVNASPDTINGPASTATNRSTTPLRLGGQSKDSSVLVQEPSMVPKDVLNLFHEDVKPESVRDAHGKSSVEESSPSETTRSQVESMITVHQAGSIPQGPTKEEEHIQEEAPASNIRAKTPQRMSLESYQAQRRTVETTNSAETTTGTTVSSDLTASARTDLSLKPPHDGPVDVEMLEETKAAQPSKSKELALQEFEDVAVSEESSSLKVEAPSVPKVKLSLQDYLRQRQEASLRSTIASATEGKGSLEQPKSNTVVPESEDGAASVRNSNVDASSDTEMAEPSSIVTTTATDEKEAVGSDMAAKDSEGEDYFKISNSLPTPLIGLSSGAQADRPSNLSFHRTDAFFQPQLDVFAATCSLNFQSL